MTLDENLFVVVSAFTGEHDGPEDQVGPAILSLHGKALRRDAPIFEEPAGAYLAYHREQVFERRLRSH